MIEIMNMRWKTLLLNIFTNSDIDDGKRKSGNGKRILAEFSVLRVAEKVQRAIGPKVQSKVITLDLFILR